MNQLECPYCGKDMDDPDDKGESGMLHEHECPHCEKYFVFEVEYNPSYSSRKADCLNGGEHDYKKTATFPEIYARMRCRMCGDEKPIEGHN